MSVTAVVGLNWGDEGKGKMTDFFTEEADMVVRFQGGSNAGHTIINDRGKFALHLLPSGVFRRQAINILGPGVAVNPWKLVEELTNLRQRGIDQVNLVISERAQILLPYHILLDTLEEERRADRKFGSTKSGIAPFYSDKYAKVGIQVTDLRHPEILRDKLHSTLEVKNVLIEHLYSHPPVDADEIWQQLMEIRDQVLPFIADTTALLSQALAKGQDIFLEGQLGALRDPDHGIYPFVTSSSTLAGFAPVGAGIPAHALTRIVGVTKCYSSCVGAGPFVTELFGPEGEELRRRGGDSGEYGATTGRPRRVGWFDAVATRYGAVLQGTTEVALTMLDVLGYLDQIPVCTAYRIDGQQTTDFPPTTLLEKAEPVYEYLPGWKCDVSQATSFEQLPKQAQDYVLYLEEKIGAPIRWISTGPHRQQTLRRDIS